MNVFSIAQPKAIRDYLILEKGASGLKGGQKQHRIQLMERGVWRLFSSFLSDVWKTEQRRGKAAERFGLFFSSLCLSLYQTVYLIFETTFISAFREITDEYVEKMKDVRHYRTENLKLLLNESWSLVMQINECAFYRCEFRLLKPMVSNECRPEADGSQVFLTLLK